ncbi:uncharacterized protein LOC134290278 [Aedes albopictus]|uniref:Reverse transcriptase n=1 Tax=Aedes albopictus TaxID=7160 RepID=A0ABM1Z3V4_AEDAL
MSSAAMQSVNHCKACNRPDHADDMVACDICGTWFHYTCAGVQASICNKPWHCGYCSSRDDGTNSSAISVSSGSSNARLRLRQLEESKALEDRLLLQQAERERAFLAEKHQLEAEIQSDKQLRGSTSSFRSRHSARSRQSYRSEVQKLQGQEKEHQQMQQQQYSAWSRVPKLPRVEVAKKLVDELHEYVDKRSNVHKDIKALVIKIQGALGSAVKEWKSMAQRAEDAEKELLAAKTASEASRTSEARRQITNKTAEKNSVVESISQRMQTTPFFTPKRPRASPGEVRPGGSKKHKDAPVTGARHPAENVVTDGHTPWQVVGKRKAKSAGKSRSDKRKLIKRKNKGEALIVKTSDDSYAEVLRTMRTNPDLRELGEDVKKIRRTRNGEMILELRRDPKGSSSSYKELTEKAMGDKVEVRALCPEATLLCKDLDEVTSEQEVEVAMKEQCELGEARMTIRVRNGPSGTKVASIKLPIDAANKALRVGKIKIGWCVCPLSISQQPEVCFKCLEYGHLARDCKGPDRSKLCRRCGEEGHKAQDCRKSPKCLICANTENSNHPTGGRRCPAFKQLLLRQAVVEQNCDVAIISEPYRIPPEDGNWTADRAKTVAVWTAGRYPVQEVVYCADEGFVVVKINGIFICSCYAPPRWTIEQFNQMLDRITEELIGRRPVVIAGDFNAWAVEWGSRLTTPRGSSLLEALAKLNIDIANEGSTSTYRREGRESIVDVTFCSPVLMGAINWRVCEEYTHSDHQAIRYHIGGRARLESRGTQTNERRWRTANFEKDVFVEALRLESNSLNLSADELVAVLSRACDATMPRMGKPRNSRHPVYWWNPTIADLRAQCLRARRRMQRARNDGDREQRRLPYRAARAALNKAIKLSKKACLDNLCHKANMNPWGSAYKVAMSKIKGPAVPPDRCPEKMKVIIEALFPIHEPTIWPPTPYVNKDTHDEEIRVTNEELIAVAKVLPIERAPGPDGIPNVALKAAIYENPDMFRSTIQHCIEEGSFPDIWKRQKLVLLPKPGKLPGDPSAYRPICLLDTVGKLLERVVLNRLTKYTESESGLSELQFGFRKGRSTVDAIRTIVDAMQTAQKQQRRGNRYCAVVTLDVKNAFNSASWAAIADSLHRLRVPEYLCQILKSYFQNRRLIYETDAGKRSVAITAGVPQGSILGPTLWNVMYDEVLKLSLPRGVKVVGFADDVALLVIGETREEVEVLATEAIDTVEDWMREKKLSLAHHKTEIVVISNRKNVQHATIVVGECTIDSKREVRHLGVMLDDRLNFNNHVDYVCKKATVVISALSRIMPNNSAIISSKRRLLASVSSSIVRYAAPVWSSALKTGRNRAQLNRTSRLMAMRVSKETPEHVIFSCPRFAHSRGEMAAIVGVDVNVENIVERMCSDEEKWNVVNRTVVQIMVVLQQSWREEQRSVSGDIPSPGNSLTE